MKQVTYTRDALKALRTHGNVAARIMKAVAEYAADQPAHANNVRQLVGSDAKRLRVGDHRVIFEETADAIIVTKCAPRGEVYE